MLMEGTGAYVVELLLPRPPPEVGRRVGTDQTEDIAVQYIVFREANIAVIRYWASLTHQEG